MTDNHDPSIPQGGAGELAPEEKRRLLAELLRKRAAKARSEFPLTHGQRALFFLHRMAPESAAYNALLAVRIRSAFDGEALRGAFASLVQRHPSLRTTYSLEGGEGRQQVREDLALDWLEVEASSLTEEALLEQVRQDAAAPFDLQVGPPFRVRLYRRGVGADDDAILVFHAHHIGIDFWSFGLLLTEFGKLYPALLAGEAHRLPPVSGLYSDFVAERREALAGAEGEQLWEYWRRQMADPLPVLDLFTDRPRPAVQTFRGASRPWQLDLDLSARLRAVARDSGSTLNATLLAALYTLLHRFTGQRDLLVGSPMAGRLKPEHEGIVGYFANVVPLRGDLSREAPEEEAARGDGPSFTTVLGRTRRTVIGALEHQGMPFPLLVDRLQGARDPGRGPLFDVVFALESPRMDRDGIARLIVGDPGVQTSLGGLRLEAVPVGQQEGQFDLTFHLLDMGSEISGVLVYNSDLYDAATVDRMGRVYRQLLVGIAEDPGCSIQHLEILPPAERHQLVVEWNPAVGREAIAVGGVVESFEAQALRAPEALAVDDGTVHWSYGELDRRANALAHHLRPLLEGHPEPRVAVCLPRSGSLILAELAALKAGAAFVPMDAAYPDQRLRFLLEDCGCAVLLTHGALAPRFGETPVSILHLEDPEIAALPPRAEPPPRSFHPAAAAYAIYTSGSTGTPKGVVVSHGALGNLVRWHRRAYAVGPEDRATQLAGPAFDASVWEVWPYLAAGASLWIPNEEERGTARNLLGYLDARGITITFLPTPLAEAVLALPPAEVPRGLRRLLTGGDQLHRRPAATARFALINHYGPTENAVVATCCPVAPENGAAPLPPIGRPIEGCRAYILDARGALLPPGVPGELVLGGQSLARGYLGRPALTAERFVPDPFSETPGDRLYRTGDLTRWVNIEGGGTLEFLGRNDFQVKIRGFRVEIGEIESALGEHPAVAEAVVTAREIGGERRLVAYLVLGPDHGLEAAEDTLREAARQRLPEYMVPAHFVFLEALPLNPSGKVDRRALPAPVRDRGEAPGPLRGIAAKIAAVWSAVLGIERVGLRESFFDLGGHSLKMVEVQERLEAVLDRPIPIVDLFRFPTIQALAHFLDPDSAPKASPKGATTAAPSVAADEPIAIIGWSGRFPGAGSVEALWRNLLAGEESISFFSDEELEAGGLLGGDPTDPNYVKAGGVLEGIDRFDAGFFGYNPREAEVLDPQQRLFLEHAWEALEDAGYEPERYAEAGGRIGVHAGVGFSNYLFFNLAHSAVAQAAGLYQLMVSNDKDFLPSRVAYKLNLKGPAVNVQTACSTSLVAVHQACRALRAGDCDIALAGGAAVRVPHKSGYPYQPGMILSPDGHCRPFDADAQGTVGGNGVALVVLKPLSRALGDGDSIRAVIRGSAINNDGSSKVSFTALSVDGQAAVVRDAVAAAGVTPGDIGYIEAHGTGTELGDPIEIAALKEVFTDLAPESCTVGALRGNVGHLDAAAGVAGLIKAALAVRTGQIPATLHFRKPNPKLGLEGSPFHVSGALQPWRAQEGPRRAGVSSFGIGGTNAHVIVEQPPAWVAEEEAAEGTGWHLLPLSARSPAALDEAARRLATALEDPPGRLADIAHTLQEGRKSFECRRLVMARDVAEARRALTGEGPEIPPEIPPEAEATLATVGRQWLAGETVDWLALHAGAARRRVPLPTYPWERQRYWLDPTTAGRPSGTEVGESAVGHPRPELATPFVAPRDALEERLAALWGEMLGIAGVGVKDDLFELGGHSLLGTQILARVRQSFGVEIALSRLFQAPTVAGLADAVRAAGGVADRTAEVRPDAAPPALVVAEGEELDFDQLSDENVEALLVGMLSEEEWSA
jgi:amino acid adenylation domain-containing protein